MSSLAIQDYILYRGGGLLCYIKFKTEYGYGKDYQAR